MRLLIVEDEARIAELVQRALARAGFAVDAVALCADARAALTVTSYAILEHLMRRLGRVVAKPVLEEKLYGLDDEHGSNTIPVHVHHLRRKLLDAGATAEIHTVRGVGYILTESSI